MNTEIKALLSIILDGVKVTEDVIAKNYNIEDITKLVGDIPAAIANAGGLPSEIKGLSSPAEEQDLIDFITSKLAVVTDSQKAIAIVNVSLKMVNHIAQDSIALAEAIKS